MYRATLSFKLWLRIPNHVHGGKLTTFLSYPINGDRVDDMVQQAKDFRKEFLDANKPFADMGAESELTLKIRI